MSCAVGTPERQIIDACAAQIAAAYIGQYLTGGMMDINTKSGLELDQFCLVPGTPVTTPLGVKAIEALCRGDEVITHTGKVAEVLATSTRTVDEDVVTIRTAVGVEYTMTKNHPVWVTKKSTMTMLAPQVGNWRRDGSKDSSHALRLRGLGSRTVWDSRDLDREFVPAGELVPGDIVWGPDPGSPGTENVLSVGTKRLLGYYLAEGHIHHRERSSEIGFSFHREEVEYQDEVESLLRAEWGITHIRRQHPGPNSTQLICYNTRLARWLEGFVGKGAHGKHLPFGMEKEDWTPLIATYWRGDGTAAKQQSLRAKTVSPTLAWQLYDQMIRLGLSPRMVKSAAGPVVIMGREGRCRDTWQVSVDGESARLLSEAIDYPLRHRNDKNYAPVSVRVNGFIGSAVVDITESHYQGNVHNIEVAGDNSYELLGSFGVHNCGIFGFGRLQGSPATGVVTLTMTNVATTSLAIPLNSQFYTTPGLAGISTTLYFSSTQAVTLPAGSYQVSIPVQCTSVGTAGNVPPDSITSQSAAIGSSVVTNTASLTGGTNAETDAQLRQRFMDTLLRNISGTRDWYINTALQNNNVARAVVYGPISLYVTQINVPASSQTLNNLVANATNTVKYVWENGSSVFTGIGTSNETFYSPVDDYTLGTGADPTFINLGGALTTNQIVDFEFQYTTSSSRNDPANGITNKIDVFVDGTAPFMVTETCVVSSTTFSTTATNMLYTGNFERVGVGSAPSSGNRFMRLGSVPIMNFPTTITSNGVVYTQGTHYYLLQPSSANNQYTTLRGSQLEISGIEWLTGGATNGSPLVLNYTYNQTPQILDAVMQSSKQICTDVLCHVADYQYIVTCLTVEYSRNYAISTVNTAIVARLQIFYQTLGFGAAIIFSQLEAAVQQVLGVNEVHVTTEAENGTNYGIQVYDASNNTVQITNSPFTDDFVINDNQLCVYQNTVTLQAPNIGGAG